MADTYDTDCLPLCLPAEFLRSLHSRRILIVFSGKPESGPVILIPPHWQDDHGIKDTKSYTSVNEKDTTMTGKMRIWLLFGLILVACVLLAGCSSQSSSENTVVTTPTTIPAPMYVAGDIVAKSSTQAAPLWLILSYDQTPDQYERTLVYQNPDGSWGYRVNSNSDTLDRADMEKLYPVKVAHVAVTSVPIVTPTVPTTVQTTVSGSPPSITSVSPTSAAQNAIVSLTIAGSNFQSGATAELVQPGYTPVVGSGLSVSSTQITGSFNLNGLDMGVVNVEVRNPDGQSTTLPGAFTIGQTPPVISGVTPTTGALNSSVSLTIDGTNFADAVKVFLGLGSSEIDCTNTQTVSSNQVTTTCDLSNSNAATGSWNVTLVNIDGGQSSSWSTFSITNSS
jgi:hypothetical protein